MSENLERGVGQDERSPSRSGETEPRSRAFGRWWRARKGNRAFARQMDAWQAKHLSDYYRQVSGRRPR